MLGLRERHGVRLPLVLMDRFRTREESLAALARYPELEADLPLDFIQGKVPKIGADDLAAGRLAAPIRSSSGPRPATATSTRRSSRRACSKR